MKAETRRSLATLLIGILAALAGFWSVELLHERRCRGAAGHWDAVRRTCTLADGRAHAPGPTGLAAVAIGVVVAVVVAFVLQRIFTFATRPRR